MSDPTNIKFACPHCGRHLAAEPDMAGVELACPDCGKSLRVPAAPVAANPGQLEMDVKAPERKNSSTEPNALDKARDFGTKVATTTNAVARPILRAIKEKWNALDPKIKKRVVFSAGGLAALFLVVSILSGGKPESRDAEREVREAMSSLDSVGDHLSDMASDLIADAKKAEADQKLLERQLEEDLRHRKEEERIRLKEEEVRRTRLAKAEEDARREREEEQAAEQRRREMERQARETEEANKTIQAEQYARDILPPLGLKPADFGWKTIPDSPRSDFGIVAKKALVQQENGQWFAAAVSLVSLENFRRVRDDDAKGIVDAAASVIQQIQARAKMFETYLSAEFCHLKPGIHVQDSIKNKVSVSWKGRHYSDCIKKQNEKDWLGLLNGILSQNGDREHEVYPSFDERNLLSILEHSDFSLACQTDIENGDDRSEWDLPQEPQLGFLTIRVSQTYNRPIKYFDPVEVQWTEFREKLPSDDGYMKQGWNLLVPDVYILHTNYREAYEPHVKEMQEQISNFAEKMAKEVKLGDLTEVEAKAKVLDFARNKAASFAKLVESGKPANEYQVKLNKAKEDAAAETAAQAEAARKELEDTADQELFSKINSEMKVYVSESIAAKGVTVSISGKNAKRWKELQQAKAEKDWRRVCEILLKSEKKKKNEFGELDIFDAGSQLDHLCLKFIISIRGEDITKSCNVVPFTGDDDFEYDQGLDNHVDDSSGNNGGTTYKIERYTKDGDFSIVRFENYERFVSEMNEWRARSGKAERALEEKLDDKDISETEYVTLLRKARKDIKKAFLKKYSLVPVKLTPGK